VDWDWEITALTLAALACAGAALAAGRRDRGVVPVSRRIRQVAAVATVGVAAFAAVGLAGNRAAEASEDATFREDWPRAEEQARRAHALAPWSSEPWRLLGEAQLQQGRLVDARASFERGLERDSRSWELWLDLAFSTTGAERTRAARTALRLNPLSPEIAQIRPALGLPPVAP
jgi:cytochrome c-type biogenesis protein CcmH/NrfG